VSVTALVSQMPAAVDSDPALYTREGTQEFGRVQGAVRGGTWKSR
jgi:hypothetical protein